MTVGFTIYGRGGHLGHVNQIPQNKLLFARPMEALHKMRLKSAKQVVLQKMFRTVDGRTAEAAHLRAERFRKE